MIDTSRSFWGVERRLLRIHGIFMSPRGVGFQRCPPLCFRFYHMVSACQPEKSSEKKFFLRFLGTRFATSKNCAKDRELILRLNLKTQTVGLGDTCQPPRWVGIPLTRGVRKGMDGVLHPHHPTRLFASRVFLRQNFTVFPTVWTDFIFNVTIGKIRSAAVRNMQNLDHVYPFV